VLWSLVVCPERWGGLLSSHLPRHSRWLQIILSPVLVYLDAPAGKVFPTPGTPAGRRGGLGQGLSGWGSWEVGGWVTRAERTRHELSVLVLWIPSQGQVVAAV